MGLATEIGNTLKTLTFDPSATRQLRALYVAQILGYRVPLSVNDDVSAVMDEQATTLTQLLNQVNEITVVDVKLARTYFQRVVQARLVVLQSPVDPVLAAYILRSETQLDGLNPDDRQVFVSFMATAEFVSAARTCMQAEPGEWAPIPGDE